MKLTFKSGRTIEISENEASILARNIVNGTNVMQIFERPDNGLIYKIINLDEIESITED